MLEKMNDLKRIKRKAELMSILLNRSIQYYTKIKNTLQFPLVFTTASLVVVNAYDNEKPDMVKLINVIVNSANMVFMGLLKFYNVTEKIENFTSRASEYLDLAHSIDSEMSDDYFNQQKINHYQNLFDFITKSTLVNAIPDYIINDIKKRYPEITLPLVLGELSASNASSADHSPQTYTLRTEYNNDIP